jgi:hypothetical protein
MVEGQSFSGFRQPSVNYFSVTCIFPVNSAYLWTSGKCRLSHREHLEDVMDSKRVVTALRREKKLLEQVLHLAECQLELVQTGRLEDLELLLSLRAEPMRELAMSEVNVLAEMPHFEHDRTLTPREIEELHCLNLQIINLADRIVGIDERAEQLAEFSEFFCLLPEKSAQRKVD